MDQRQLTVLNVISVRTGRLWRAHVKNVSDSFRLLAVYY